MSSTYSKEIAFMDEDYGEMHGGLPMVGRLREHHTSDMIIWETRKSDGSEFMPRAYFKPAEFAALMKAANVET